MPAATLLRRARWTDARLALGFGLLVIVFWLALAMATDHALMADNVEQEVWAHSFEWGYHKHPPLPTWLLIAAQHLLGHAWWVTPVLAALCLATTLLATHSLARHLAGARVAQLGSVLWGLHLGLTWRATLYNHNTVLIALCALLALLSWQAQRAPTWRRWTLVGLTAGAALLTKYQAVVLLALLAFLFAVRGAWREPAQRWGVCWAAVVALAMVSPHLYWLVHHDWGPLRHAGKHLPDHWGWAQLGHVLGFAVQQLRLFWPALAVLAVMRWRAPRRPKPGTLSPLPPHSLERTWWLTLVAGPPVLVLTLGALGVHLQNHWGLQSFQFAALGLALALRRFSTVKLPRLLWFAALLHGALALAQVYGALQQRHEWNGRVDRYFPARAVTAAALADWRAVTDCPLHYTVGWSFEAGTLSVYSGQHPQVFESGSIGASPWIDEQRLQRDGALYLAYERRDLPANASRVGALQVTATPQPPMGSTLHWAVVAPQQPCPP